MRVEEVLTVEQAYDLGVFHRNHNFRSLYKIEVPRWTHEMIESYDRGYESGTITDL
jgi:hypothetical protein